MKWTSKISHKEEIGLESMLAKPCLALPTIFQFFDFKDTALFGPILYPFLFYFLLLIQYSS